jgi:hypothetical protein
MMVVLLLYGYRVGIPSSRKIERRAYEEVAFRVLAGGQHPDHTRISEFRRIHGQALSGLFVQVLILCRKAGLARLGHVALDGTKIKANASNRRERGSQAQGPAQLHRPGEQDPEGDPTSTCRDSMRRLLSIRPIRSSWRRQ